jgi:hypothetical protein
MRTFITTIGGAVALAMMSLTTAQPAAALPLVSKPAGVEQAGGASEVNYRRYGHRHGYNRPYYRNYGYGYGGYPRYRSYGYYGGPGISFSFGPRHRGYGYGW